LPLRPAGGGGMGRPMSRRAVPAIVLVPLLVVALVVSSSACGTIANFTGGAPVIGGPPENPPPPVAYGGVQWDLERALKSEATPGQKALIFPLWLLELGLSATLDTATLPVVWWVNARLAWERATSEPDAPVRSPRKGTSPSWGLFPGPYRLTPAEEVLNPPADDEESD
jgi:hypothetical protein